jgi:uncharacterized iron-regulated membrane protein
MVQRLLSRQLWVIVHRWAGLSLALFLVVMGLTGMAISWEDALEERIAPQLLLAPPPRPDAPMIDATRLRAQAQARHPGMMADFLPLSPAPGHALRMRVYWVMPAGQAAPAWDELFVDPYTGRELGHRHWGDLGEGPVNLLPWLYLLHYSLLLGTSGELILGLVALVWTIDCFVGFYLTFPVRLRTPAPAKGGTLRRWRPAWLVRWGSGRHKVTFDLHRAGGLWVWPVLLVIAWSSVAFNLPQVYVPVMRLAGATDDRALLRQPAPPRPAQAQPMDFTAAEARGVALARAATGSGPDRLIPQGNAWLWHLPGAGLYVYGFTTVHDVPDEGGGAQVAFDDVSGTLRQVTLPHGTPGANRLTDWIEALHMARVFGWPWKVFMTLVGAAVTMLSVTGVLIWTKKRSARLLGRRRRPRAQTLGAANLSGRASA